MDIGAVAAIARVERPDHRLAQIISEKPMIALSGVRSSWLIRAMKCGFRLARFHELRLAQAQILVDVAHLAGGRAHRRNDADHGQRADNECHRLKGRQHRHMRQQDERPGQGDRQE